MGHSVFKGSLNLGMLSIPIKVAAAAKAESVSFNMLHNGCGGRINQKLVCATCAKEITRGETHKGHAEGGDVYLHITDEEIKGIAPSSSKIIEITSVVPAAEVDPVYFESSYFLAAEEAGRMAYKLLADALKAGRVYAMGKISMSQREHVIVIRPYQKGLMFHTLYYRAEVREATCDVSDVPVADGALALIGKLLAQYAGTFNPSEFVDGYAVRIEELLEAKRQSKPVPAAAAAAKKAPAMDLMDALAKSLAAAPKGKRKAA